MCSLERAKCILERPNGDVGGVGAAVAVLLQAYMVLCFCVSCADADTSAGCSSVWQSTLSTQMHTTPP